MTHLDEDTLILYYYGEGDDLPSVKRHLRDCERCREDLEAITHDLGHIRSMDAPQRGADYGARVWRTIAPRLRPQRARRARLVAAAAILLAATFLVGRWSTRWQADFSAPDVRERILLVALGEHLSRSEVWLLEAVNAEGGVLGRDAARELVRESRLYRQTAYRVGDVTTVETLDELERLFLDATHGTTSNEMLKSRIEERDLLFKIRVLQAGVTAREEELALTKF